MVEATQFENILMSQLGSLPQASGWKQKLCETTTIDHLLKQVSSIHINSLFETNYDPFPRRTSADSERQGAGWNAKRIWRENGKDPTRTSRHQSSWYQPWRVPPWMNRWDSRDPITERQMIGVYNQPPKRKKFRFHYHSQKVIGSLGSIQVFLHPGGACCVLVWKESLVGIGISKNLMLQSEGSILVIMKSKWFWESSIASDPCMIYLPTFAIQIKHM